MSRLFFLTMLTASKIPSSSTLRGFSVVQQHVYFRARIGIQLQNSLFIGLVTATKNSWGIDVGSSKCPSRSSQWLAKKEICVPAEPLSSNAGEVLRNASDTAIKFHLRPFKIWPRFLKSTWNPRSLDPALVPRFIPLQWKSICPPISNSPVPCLC